MWKKKKKTRAIAGKRLYINIPATPHSRCQIRLCTCSPDHCAAYLPWKRVLLASFFKLFCFDSWLYGGGCIFNAAYQKATFCPLIRRGRGRKTREGDAWKISTRAFFFFFLITWLFFSFFGFVTRSIIVISSGANAYVFFFFRFPYSKRTPL